MTAWGFAKIALLAYAGWRAAILVASTWRAMAYNADPARRRDGGEMKVNITAYVKFIVPALAYLAIEAWAR
jgi:hypothetical protein